MHVCIYIYIDICVFIYTPYQDHMVLPGMSPLQEMEIPATAPVATAQRKNEAKRKNAEPEEPGFEDGSTGRVENHRKIMKTIEKPQENHENHRKTMKAIGK